MTDHDDAARELVRRAHETDPDRVEFDAAAGLTEVVNRARLGESDQTAAPAARIAFFISYRLDDKPVAAAYLDRELGARFGPDNVFRDKRFQISGPSFAPELWRALHRSEVLLAIIGPNWLAGADDRWTGPHSGKVRREIATALQLGVRVVAVLLGETPMPSRVALPADIAALADSQQLRLRRRDREYDLAPVLDALARLVPASGIAPPATWTRPPTTFEKRTIEEVRRRAESTAVAQGLGADQPGGTLLGLLTLTDDQRIVGGVYHEAATGTLAELAEIPCRTFDPDLWFSDSPVDLELARSLCAGCPVRAECLAGAIERAEPWGVWGGEIFERGAVIPRKRPRGRPRKEDVAADENLRTDHDRDQAV